jgi:hypothetical protein
MRRWRAVQTAILILSTLPGIAWLLGALAFAAGLDRSANPRVHDLWDGLTILDYMLLLFTSPILIPLAWLLFWNLRRGEHGFAPPMSLTLAVFGTLGALAFWIRFLG